jgi:hypothetical protein
MGSIAGGQSQDDSLDVTGRRLSSPEGARQLLDECAIDRTVAKAWVKWFATTDGDELRQSQVTAADISEAIGVDGRELLSQLESLDVVTWSPPASDEESDTWALDRIVLAAAATLFTD